MYYDYNKRRDIEALKGLTLASVEGKAGGDEIRFVTTDGRSFLMYHEQDCCESVHIEDIVGDLRDLVGEPITEAEAVDGDAPAPEYHDSYSWTFYKIGTRKGSVTLRWLGQSNGYYSESVDFVETT